MTTVSFPKNATPNAEAQTMGNLVPGAEMLGYGFDIFGTYDFDAALRPLLTLGTPSSWPAPSGKTYDLPANVSTPDGSSSTASAQSFASSSEFNSYFQASASVTGSYGAFSGSFSSTYTTSLQSSNSYSWALVEADFKAWSMNIAYSPEIIRADVLSDPDWKDLPTTFEPGDEENVLAFYRFFQKFGTHFISNVVTGGTLYYYFAVSQSARYTSTDITASASAEYQGLIAKTSAEASTHWSQCSRDWTKNRQSHATTVPATTGVIDWVNPLSGSFDQNGNFDDWKKAVVENPSRCKFSLTPIWALFHGQQWTALQQAYRAYGSSRISVHATRSSLATILVNGTPLTPTNGYPPSPSWDGKTTVPTNGYHLAVLNAKSLAVELNKFYPIDYSRTNWPDPTCDQMVSDLHPYVGSSKHILIAATCNLDDASSPNHALYSTLKSFGGGSGLDRWIAMPNHNCSSGLGSVVYALIGLGGSAVGLEGYGDFYYDPAPTTVDLNALLLPTGGVFMPMPYSS